MRISDWSSDVCSSDLIDAVVVGRDAQVDRRVRACEGVEAREQPARREGADDADLERLAEVAVRILVERRGDAVERLGDDGDERMAFVGEREPARQAVEEAGAEAAFKLGDLMADRALADLEFEPRAGEGEVARRRPEGAEGVEDRTSGGSGERVSVRVYLGGCRIPHKKNE